MPILAHPDAVFVGLDIHKDSISAGILNPGFSSPSFDGGIDELRGLRPRRSSRSPRRASSSAIRAACCSTNNSSAATCSFNSSQEGSSQNAERSSVGIPNDTPGEFPGGGWSAQVT